MASVDDQSMPMTLSLGWVIVFVDDAVEAAAFYTTTFGIPHDFTSPDGSHAQLDTGETKLGFATYERAAQNIPGGVQATGTIPANAELLLVHQDVDAALARALAAGCTLLAPPADKPHGQRVAFVRDPFGTLIELGTPLPT